MVGGSGKDSELGAVLPNFARRQPTSSGARFEMVMPSETRNLQLKIGRAWSSSDSWQSTRQYWQSWFQQKRPYGIVSGLMNWKARRSELRSGTRNVFPRMVISTSFSYGRKTSDMRGVPVLATGCSLPRQFWCAMKLNHGDVRSNGNRLGRAQYSNGKSIMLLPEAND